MQAQPIKFPTKPLPTGVDYAITGASRFNDGVMTTANTPAEQGRYLSQSQQTWIVFVPGSRRDLQR